MFSTVITVRKREDISREDFINYYENKHAPLIGSLLPDLALSFRRSYFVDNDPLSVRIVEGRGDDTALPNISLIVEIGFATRADAEKVIEVFLSSDILAQVLADENNFIAKGGVRWRVVEVRD